MGCDELSEVQLKFTTIPVVLSFVLIVYFTIKPLELTIYNGLKIVIDYSTGAVLALLLLIMTTAVGLNELQVGIVGNDRIQPYQVIILFFALAYVCVSLDRTGIFAKAATWTARKSGKLLIL